VLQIKLPKRRVEMALTLCANARQEMSDTAMWDDILYYKNECIRLRAMADACNHSVGDVYISMELWTEIMAYYE